MTVTPSSDLEALSGTSEPGSAVPDVFLDAELEAAAIDDLGLEIPDEVPSADASSSRTNRRDTDGAGFTLDEFASLLSKYDYNFKPGDIVNGTVFALESKGAMIDIGAKTAAFMPLQEVSINRVEHLSDVLEPGEVREFFILSEENEDGQLTLSIRRIEYQR
ncbi:MAG: S1 RNA-binding domain-containing protein, partial [Cyanobium sp.]